jgi:hypothetical protein
MFRNWKRGGPTNIDDMVGRLQAFLAVTNLGLTRSDATKLVCCNCRAHLACNLSCSGESGED